MVKILHFLGNIGKIITLYFTIFMLSLMCVSLSPSLNQKSHNRCVVKNEDYNFAFLDNYSQINNYQTLISCNTIDIIIKSNTENKEEAIALIMSLSYKLPLNLDLQLTLQDNSNNIFYFRIIEKGEVIVV